MLGLRQTSHLTFLVCVITCGTMAPAKAQTGKMVQFYALGRVQKGIELAEFAHEMVIMGRDGWIHSIDPRKQASRIDRIGGTYEPASTIELRNGLRSEFGPNFEVVATKNFLVVQPKGRGNRWPKLFEASHRSFYTFMKKKGVRVRPGRFPMVAVVFPRSSCDVRRIQTTENRRISGCRTVRWRKQPRHDPRWRTVGIDRRNGSTRNSSSIGIQ